MLFIMQLRFFCVCLPQVLIEIIAPAIPRGHGLLLKFEAHDTSCSSHAPGDLY